MTYKWGYKTPEGFDDMMMCGEGEFLTGLWFQGSRDEAKHCTDVGEKFLPIFAEVCKWLDVYFSGKKPDFVPRYKIEGQTNFRRLVTEIMNEIPYGEAVTYGDIAAKAAKRLGKEKMSAQAVGGAVGSNPICIIVPCHRVIGANGKLTGYGGGIENKAALLKLEGIKI